MRPEDFSTPERRRPQADISFRLPVLQDQVHLIVNEPSLATKEPFSQFPSSKHPSEEIEERDQGEKIRVCFLRVRSVTRRLCRTQIS